MVPRRPRHRRQHLVALECSLPSTYRRGYLWGRICVSSARAVRFLSFDPIKWCSPGFDRMDVLLLSFLRFGSVLWDVVPSEWSGGSKISGFRGQEGFHLPIARWTTASPIQGEGKGGRDVLQQRFATHSPCGWMDMAWYHQSHPSDARGRGRRRFMDPSICTDPCWLFLTPSMHGHRRRICPCAGIPPFGSSNGVIHGLLLHTSGGDVETSPCGNHTIRSNPTRTSRRRPS